jgi:hypothetical protein
MNMKTYDNILELASLKRCHISQKKKLNPKYSWKFKNNNYLIYKLKGKNIHR